MGLTQVSTAGVKDDAVTAGKIPANAVGTSEIAADAVTGAQIADDAIDSEHYADGSIDTAHIADDAVTADKLANAINTDIAAKTVLTGSTNNTVTTVTGANAIQGEANLTFDGDVLTASSKLVVSHDDWDGLRVVNTNADANGAYLDLVKDSSSMADNDESGVIRFRGDDDAGNEHTFADIRCQILDVSNGTEDGHLQFFTSYDGAYAERLRITRSGNIKVIDGDLQINTAGHGIDFSTHANAGGATSELLDDYESGTWTPTITGWDTVTPYSGSNYHYGWYVKVGRAVSFGWKIYMQGLTTVSTDAKITMTGLPFTGGGHVTGPIAHFRFDIPEFGVADNNYWSYMPQGTSYFYNQKNSGGTVTNVDATANYSNVWTMGSGAYMI